MNLTPHVNKDERSIHTERLHHRHRNKCSLSCESTTIFLKKFCPFHMSFSCPYVLFVGHWYLCYGLLVTSALGFKAGWIPCVFFVASVILRFTSGVTPADCIRVSMAAQPFQSMYLQMCNFVYRYVFPNWYRYIIQTHIFLKIRSKSKIIWQI